MGGVLLTVDVIITQNLQEHQNNLLESQNEILASQEGAREKLAHNLEQLTREKQLINSGQEQLTNMTMSIHQQLGKRSLGLVSTCPLKYVLQKRQPIYLETRRRA